MQRLCRAADLARDRLDRRPLLGRHAHRALPGFLRISLRRFHDSKRLFTWERQPEKLCRAQPASQDGMRADQKMALLRETLEPMLQRELEHRGVVTSNRGFEAKLIGWVEMT